MITLILLLIIPLVLFVIIFLFLVFKIRNSQSNDIIYWRAYVKENQTPEAYKPYENIQIKKGGNDGE